MKRESKSMSFKNVVKYIVIALISTSLFSCKSTNDSKNELANTNKSNIIKKQNTKNMREFNKALKARGLYFSGLGNINYFDKQCHNIELQSHRGSISYPENSLFSVLHALDNKFDVVEIDVRRTYDGSWLVHHDEKTGRETGTVDNKRRKIERMRDKEVGYLRHRDMNTGQLTDKMPPFFHELAIVFAANSKSNQKLNIEIKSDASQRSLEALEYIAFKYIPKGNYFFSSLNLRNLERIRKINSTIHLSFIQEPAKVSMQVLSRDLEKGAGSDPIYLRNQESLEKGKYYYLF